MTYDAWFQQLCIHGGFFHQPNPAKDGLLNTYDKSPCHIHHQYLTVAQLAWLHSSMLWKVAIPDNLWMPWKMKGVTSQMTCALLVGLNTATRVVTLPGIWSSNVYYWGFFCHILIKTGIDSSNTCGICMTEKMIITIPFCSNKNGKLDQPLLFLILVVFRLLQVVFMVVVLNNKSCIHIVTQIITIGQNIPISCLP